MATGSIPDGVNGPAISTDSSNTHGANGKILAAAPVKVNKPHHAGSPYQSVGDFLSNTNKFQIIESTLREGEQFANAFFDTGKTRTSYSCLYSLIENGPETA